MWRELAAAEASDHHALVEVLLVNEPYENVQTCAVDRLCGVLANAVAPGFVRTGMSQRADGTDETDTDAFRARYLESGRLPLGRGALPSEIFLAVAFLTDRANTCITGQSIKVDGALTMTF